MYSAAIAVLTFSLLGGASGPDGGRGELPRSGSLAEQLRRQEAETARFERRAAAERLLGERDLRRLDEVRFHLEREAWMPGYELAEDPHAFEEVRDTLASSLRELGRDYLEQALELDLLEDRVKRRWRNRGERRSRDGSAGPAEGGGPDDSTADGHVWRLRLSPQADLGSHSSLGLKLRLASSRHPLLGSTSFLVRRELEGGGLTLRVQLARGGHLFQLQQILDDAELGNVVALFVRTRF